MTTIHAAALTPMLRSMPSAREYDVRDPSGTLVLTASRRECELLSERGHVEGISSRGGVLKHLRLTVAARVAITALRRRLCASGRTVSEASQLTTRENTSGGVVYSHHMGRIRAYRPSGRPSDQCGLQPTVNGVAFA